MFRLSEPRIYPQNRFPESAERSSLPVTETSIIFDKFYTIFSNYKPAVHNSLKYIDLLEQASVTFSVISFA